MKYPLGLADQRVVEEAQFVISVAYDATDDEEGTTAGNRLATTETMLWLARPSAARLRFRAYLRPIPSNTGEAEWIPYHTGSRPYLSVHPRDVGTRLTGGDLKRTAELVSMGIEKRRNLNQPTCGVARVSETHRPIAVLVESLDADGSCAVVATCDKYSSSGSL